MVIRFNPLHVTITEFLDRELRIHLTSGKCIVATGSNESLSRLEKLASGGIKGDNDWIALDPPGFTSLNLIRSQNFNDDEWKELVR